MVKTRSTLSYVANNIVIPTSNHQEAPSEVQTALMVLAAVRGPGNSRGRDKPNEPMLFLEEIEKMSISLGCLETQATKLIGFHLKGRAGKWWRGYEKAKDFALMPLTWPQFKKVFRAKFLPSSRMDELRLNIATRKEAIDKIAKDARENSKKSRTTSSYSALSVGVKNMNHSAQSQSIAHSSPYPTLFRQGQESKGQAHQGHNSTSQGNSFVARPPVRSPNTQTGHGANRGGAQRGGGPARLYVVLDRQNAEASNKVITCILSVCGRPAYVLNDPGSTFSYVSTYFSIEFEKAPEQLKYPFEDRETLADLNLLDMVDFDIIDGMEWLSSCHATVDCHAKRVRFSFIGEDPILIRGEVGTSMNDLSGIPPNREIEFGIDTLPGTHPISISPYIMAPTELNEIKKQLQDLLDKGYYRRFVEGFSSLAAPLTKLTHKNVKFQWSEACEKSFQELKNRLTTTPILTLPTTTVYIQVERVDPETVQVVGIAKDYDCNILYYPGKVNVVADALIRRSMGSLARLSVVKRPIVKKAQQIASRWVRLDENLLKLKEGILSGKIKNFSLDENSVMRLNGRLCVPNVDDLRRAIMVEAHNSKYSIYPGSTKMYHDLKDIYWWNNMKRDIADFVSRFFNCQQVKAERINMDFMVVGDGVVDLIFNYDGDWVTETEVVYTENLVKTWPVNLFGVVEYELPIYFIPNIVQYEEESNKIVNAVSIDCSLSDAGSNSSTDSEGYNSEELEALKAQKKGK
ncbi:uncharacterized protein [Nicotiana tomentosiformis]|uniref:uncharacterized protein n=1 Tax=Nicotiana tomentosiformis TaxID=4098 RepID=UPI00388C3BD7